MSDNFKLRTAILTIYPVYVQCHKYKSGICWFTRCFEHFWLISYSVGWFRTGAQTASFSVNAPIKESNLGTDISFFNYKIGPTNESTVSINLSYRLQTSSDFKFSFGTKGSADLFNLDLTKINIEDQGDPLFQDLDNKFSPNIGAGI